MMQLFNVMLQTIYHFYLYFIVQCVRMEVVVRKYRGECKQEQQRGGEWKALCGTEN